MLLDCLSLVDWCSLWLVRYWLILPFLCVAYNFEEQEGTGRDLYYEEFVKERCNFLADRMRGRRDETNEGTGCGFHQGRRYLDVLGEG